MFTFVVFYALSFCNIFLSASNKSLFFFILIPVFFLCGMITWCMQDTRFCLHTNIAIAAVLGVFLLFALRQNAIFGNAVLDYRLISAQLILAMLLLFTGIQKPHTQKGT